MTSQDLESKVKQVVASLEDSKENPIVGGYVPPYIGKGEIKFVILYGSSGKYARSVETAFAAEP